MITCSKVRNLSNFRGEAALYKVSGNMDDGSIVELHVVISAITLDTFTKVLDLALTGNSSECETYIFPSNEEGDVLDWQELAGSTKGTLNHEVAIRNAGWTFIPDQNLLN